MTRRGDPVLAALDDQRGNADPGQHVTHVDLPDHPQHPQDGARAGGHPLPARQGPAGRVRAGQAGGVPLDAVALPPAAGRQVLDRAGHLLRLLPARVARRGRPPGRRRAEDQRRDPLRVPGREQDAHRAALGVAEQHGPVRTARPHHRAHVLDALLGRVLPGGPVGQPGIALVEHDQPAERGQPPVEPRRVRVLPPQVEVADQAGHDHDVPVALAEDLVGDVHAVAAARVPGDRRSASLRRPAAGAVVARAGGASAASWRRMRLLQLAQRPGWARCPSSPVQDLPQVTVGAQRLRLASGPVQRQHPVRPQPLAQRMRGGRASRAPRSAPGAGRRPAAPRPATPAPPAALSSSRAAPPCANGASSTSARAGPAPQAQCLVQPAGRERAVPGRQRGLPVPGQPLEPRRVQLVRAPPGSGNPAAG